MVGGRTHREFSITRGIAIAPPALQCVFFYEEHVVGGEIKLFLIIPEGLV